MSDKTQQTISQQEIASTRLALELALLDIDHKAECDWLSSRQSKHKPQGLDRVLGGSGNKAA